MITHSFPIQANRTVIEARERHRYPEKTLDRHIEHKANFHVTVGQIFHGLNKMNLELHGRSIRSLAMGRIQVSAKLVCKREVNQVIHL
ncbi:hypothetical protein D3C85_1386900 [compost metagenome]